MKRLLLLSIVFINNIADAQSIVKKDPSIERMVAEISADSLKSYVEAMVSFGTRNTLSEQDNPQRGIGAARNWVLNKFNSFNVGNKRKLITYIDTTTLQPDKHRVDVPTLLGNVLAILPGADTADKRIFLIGGHLDNMRGNVMDRAGDAPGANDDASGVAATLECARILGNSSFPASIYFVAFSGEEQGLLGAHFMAEKMKKQAISIEAVLNNDMIGNNNTSETGIIENTWVRVFSEGLPAFETEKEAATIRALGLENDGNSRQLARYLKETGERYVENINVVLIYRNDRFLRGGDHTAFVQRGFTAVRLCEMNENYRYQHQDVKIENGVEYGDLLKFMDFEYLRKNTAVNLATLANLAKAPAKPAKVKMEVKKLGNNTKLSWQQPAGTRVSGYYVLARETSSPIWQRKIYTTNSEMNLPLSKNNYFFAVQSVSAEGNESLPVVPTVQR